MIDVLDRKLLIDWNVKFDGWLWLEFNAFNRWYTRQLEQVGNVEWLPNNIQYVKVKCRECGNRGSQYISNGNLFGIDTSVQCPDCVRMAKGVFFLENMDLTGIEHPGVEK